MAVSVTLVPHPEGLSRTLPEVSVGLPFHQLLRLGAGDADLAELAQVASQGGGVAQLRPQLGRGLDQRALRLR